jgi:hypothetical protein
MDVIPMRPDSPVVRLAIDRTTCVWTLRQVCLDASHWKAENRGKFANIIIFPKVSFRTHMYI